jgi:uncharacterized membrane protein
MARRVFHHHQLSAANFLPMFDGVFAVATTLLVYSLPNMLTGMNAQGELLLPILSFELVGLAVLLYWFKLRRLILMARHLLPIQLLFGILALLTIVVMPKLASLVLAYGNGSGTLFRWSLSQQVNVSFLTALFLFDGLALLFALSLRDHAHLSPGSTRELTIAIECQALGLGILMLLAGMELFLIWFNSQFVWLVPLVLVAEEILVARRFSR